MSVRYVVGVDGSQESARALEWAVAEAAPLGASVDAVLAWHFPLEHRPVGPTPEDLLGIEAEWIASLDEVVDAVDEGPLDQPVRRLSVEGSHPGRTLIEQAEGAEMLVVGTRGRGGFLGLLLGSAAEYCLHHATCPTVFVPPRPLPQETRTVVGIDGSEESVAALRWAVDRQANTGGSVTALHAWNWIDLPKESQWDTYFEQSDAEGFVEKTISSSGVDRSNLEVSVVYELPSRAMIEAGADAGLLVLGSHGRNLAKMLMTGSVAHQVAHHAPVPLVIHR